jgi:hypothetical protein
LPFDALGGGGQAQDLAEGMTPATRIAEVRWVSLKDLSSLSPVSGRFRSMAREKYAEP